MRRRDFLLELCLSGQARARACAHCGRTVYGNYWFGEFWCTHCGIGWAE